MGVAAVRLFVERAVEVCPGFALTEENASDVAPICQRLAGLPPPPEPAGGRAKALPPAAQLARPRPAEALLEVFPLSPTEFRAYSMREGLGPAVRFEHLLHGGRHPAFELHDGALPQQPVGAPLRLHPSRRRRSARRWIAPPSRSPTSISSKSTKPLPLSILPLSRSSAWTGTASTSTAGPSRSVIPWA